MSGADPRLDDLIDLLAAEGFGEARVSCAGREGEIAVVEGLEPRRLAALAPSIRALGFRFVAWDMTPLHP